MSSIDILKDLAQLVFANDQNLLIKANQLLDSIEKGQEILSNSIAPQQLEEFIHFSISKNSHDNVNTTSNSTIKNYSDSFYILTDLKQTLDEKKYMEFIDIIKKYFLNQYSYQAAHDMIIEFSKTSKHKSVFKILNLKSKLSSISKSKLNRFQHNNISKAPEIERLPIVTDETINALPQQNSDDIKVPDFSIFNLNDSNISETEGFSHQTDLIQNSETLRKLDLANLISFSESDIDIINPYHIPFSSDINYSIDEYSETIFKQANIIHRQKPDAKGTVSYKDTSNIIYHPTFAGMTFADSMVLNIRYMNENSEPVNSQMKEDKPCELIHDNDNITTHFVNCYFSNDSFQNLSSCLNYIYNYDAKHQNEVLKAIFKNPKIFEKIIKPRIFDSILKLNLQRSNHINEAFWMMYAMVPPLSFEPFKMMNTSHNFLTEYSSKYKKPLSDWLTNVFFIHCDECIEQGISDANLDPQDLALIEKYCTFYKYFTLRFAPHHVLHKSQSLAFVAFPWDAVFQYYINKAAKQVFRGTKESSIRDLDYQLNQSVIDLVQMKKRKEQQVMNEKQYIAFVLGDHDIKVLLVK